MNIQLKQTPGSEQVQVVITFHTRAELRGAIALHAAPPQWVWPLPAAAAEYDASMYAALREGLPV
ncbi:MAG: hypothetical protein ACYDB1_01080 [Acidiferrobacteraceae bacterium]